MRVKTCTRCGETKCLDQFPPVRKAVPEKRQSWCRACFSEVNKKNYWKDPAPVRLRVARNCASRRAESRARAIEFLRAHRCADCGKSDILYLQFDHRTNKKFDISEMIARGADWTRILGEIAKCDVRCANCHARKTARERGYRKLEARPSPMLDGAPRPRPAMQLELGTRSTVTCRVCRLAKPITEFAVRSRKTGTRHRICRSCRSEYHRQWRAKNRVIQMPRIRRNRKKRDREIEQWIWDHLFAHGCVDCGEADLLVLQFDHLRDKVDDISTLFRRQRSWKTVLDEIAKCEVRCANCHARKTALELGNYKTNAM